MTRRIAAVVLVALLSPLALTACEPDPSTGSCAHAASSKATTESDFFGVTKPMAETFVWVRWVASTGCYYEPMWWTNWSWNYSAWWYTFGWPSTNTIAGSPWQEVYDHWRSSGVTAVSQARFHTDGWDEYGLKSRVHAAGDGWVYWYCGSLEPVNFVCEFNNA